MQASRSLLCFARADQAELGGSSARHRCPLRHDTTPEELVELVETSWDEVWAARKPDAIDRFVTDDFVITTAGVEVAGSAGATLGGCALFDGSSERH